MKQLRRRVTYGMNVAIAVGAAALLVIFANFLANKYPKRHDFIQSTDLYTISEKTISLLKSIKQPVAFYMFSNPQSSELHDKCRRLFESYKAINPLVTYTMVDEIRDIGKARKLVQDLQVDEPDTIVVTYGDSKKVLTEMDLADFYFGHDYYTGGQTKRMTKFKAEQALTSAILELMNPTKLQARFTVKHGEKSIFGFDDNGYSEVRRYLSRDNIEASPLELVALSEIALTNCDILIVAGPTRTFLDHEINLIRRYLNQGGKALFLLDPEIETGLEALLREYNVKLGNNIVVDPAGQIPGVSPLQLVIQLYRKHPITDKIKTYTIYFLARSVEVLNPENDVNRATDLALTGRDGWGEVDTDTDTFKFDPERDMAGPVSIAVIVENEKTGMRMAVVGDSEFVSNRDFFGGANRDFFMNLVNWIVDRDVLVAISPKTIEERRRLELKRGDIIVLRSLVIFGVPGVSVIAGILVYIRRRK